jgi:hypothetical protein
MSASNVIPAVFEEHLQEFAEFWQRRWEVEAGVDEVPLDLRDIDERLAAHGDGLLAAGSDALPWLIAASQEPDPWLVTAATYVLLAMRQVEADRLVGELFCGAEGERLEAMTRALQAARIDRIQEKLNQCVLQGSMPTCVAAAEVLARHRALDPRSHRWRDALQHSDPAVRRMAWRVIAVVDRRTSG